MKAPLSLVVLSIGVFASAQGGPPLLTDDPGTVEKGKWELNMAWVYRRLPALTEIELPHFDASHGISDRAHVKIEIPWVFATDGSSSVNGDGGGSTGIKYRFVDAKGFRPAISTYPQIGFQVSSRSVRNGLSQSGTSLLLPIQIQWDFEKFSVNMDSGYIVQGGASPSWLGGVAIGRKVGVCEYLAEIHGEGVFATGESNWIAQLGYRRELSEASTLIFAFGKTIASNNSPSLSWNSYLGFQFHF
jgi:hypothetical protein